MLKIFNLLIVFLCFFSASVGAQEEKKFIDAPKADYGVLTLSGVAQVRQVIDPLRLQLYDGRIVQLSNIDVPDLTPYDIGDVGLAAKALLEGMLVDKHVRLHQSKDSRNGRLNRMGYSLAHVEERISEGWVQGALLVNGLARVRPSAHNTELTAEMLALEEQARQEKRGLWADDKYAVRTPDTAAESMNSWTIVEGTVRASAMANNTIYLNFGPDWRSDFTVAIKPPVRRKLVNLGIDPLQYGGKTIRVRGWMESYNGPYLELIDPAWIQTLPEGDESTTFKSNN